MTVETLEKTVSAIKHAPLPGPIYRFLIERFPPCEIKTLAQHRAYCDLISTLMRALTQEIDTHAAAEIRQYLRIIGPIVDAFEREHWPERRVLGRETLAFLMEQNGLKQSDLSAEIGAQPYVSDILRGKKRLTAPQIGRLAKRFGVSPAVFYD